MEQQYGGDYNCKNNPQNLNSIFNSLGLRCTFGNYEEGLGHDAIFAHLQVYNFRLLIAKFVLTRFKTRDWIVNQVFSKFEMQAGQQVTEDKMDTQFWQQGSKTNSCDDFSNPEFCIDGADIWPNSIFKCIGQHKLKKMMSASW